MEISRVKLTCVPNGGHLIILCTVLSGTSPFLYDPFLVNCHRYRGVSHTVLKLFIFTFLGTIFEWTRQII